MDFTDFFCIFSHQFIYFINFSLFYSILFSENALRNFIGLCNDDVSHSMDFFRKNAHTRIAQFIQTQVEQGDFHLASMGVRVLVATVQVLYCGVLYWCTILNCTALRCTALMNYSYSSWIIMQLCSNYTLRVVICWLLLHHRVLQHKQFVSSAIGIDNNSDTPSSSSSAAYPPVSPVLNENERDNQSRYYRQKYAVCCTVELKNTWSCSRNNHWLWEA